MGRYGIFFFGCMCILSGVLHLSFGFRRSADDANGETLGRLAVLRRQRMAWMVSRARGRVNIDRVQVELDAKNIFSVSVIR